MRLLSLESCSSLFRSLKEEISPYPPVAAKVEGEWYRLNLFDKEVCEYLSAGELSPAEAVALHMELLGDLGPAELGRIVTLCAHFGIEPCTVPGMERFVKGKRSFDALRVLGEAPIEFLNYIEQKRPSLKIISIYSSLSISGRRFLHEYTIETSPSVSAFRKTVELLSDMGEENTPENYTPEALDELAGTRSSFRRDFMDSFSNLSGPLDIQSNSGFEDGSLTLRIDFSTPEEFEAKIKGAADSADRIRDIYRFLQENDIC
ncbi:hypothetical protein [Limisalsivibrio acetivorans]|uniref:hypothetical protein n=1 Tax=Limisalsivibrio acetivorans TaxID=1304888 RepID=UPI0003B50798|nr:hypothetical protein [Limisalsivibrio acetivorans]